MRFAFLALIPFFMIISQFLWENLTAAGAQIFFPIRQMHENSLYYRRPGERALSLPIIRCHNSPSTCLVYKEGLLFRYRSKSRERPAAVSGLPQARRRRQHRRLRGRSHTASSREEAEERIRYYNSIGVGW